MTTCKLKLGDRVYPSPYGSATFFHGRLPEGTVVAVDVRNLIMVRVDRETEAHFYNPKSWLHASWRSTDSQTKACPECGVVHDAC